MYLKATYFTIIDECCLLPSQVLIPQLQFISAQTSVASPVLTFVQLPIQVGNYLFCMRTHKLKFFPFSISSNTIKNRFA